METKSSMKIFLIPAIFFAVFLVFGNEAKAADYYASPNGTGTECSFSNPCKIAAFWTKMESGDILYLTDGLYRGDDSMIEPPHNYNGGVCLSYIGGSDGSPVTIKAVNDGKSIIDGEWLRQPGYLLCNNYFVLEGIRFQNSSEEVIGLAFSSHNILRRVSGYNANSHLAPDYNVCPNAKYYNYHVLDVHYQSSYNLVEDSIFGGTGRNLMTSYGDSNFNIFRRNILVGGAYTRDLTIPGCSVASSDNHGEASQLYGVSDNVVENVISFGTGDWPGHYRPLQSGMNIWANTGQQTHRNRYYGTLVMDYPYYGFYHVSGCNGQLDSSNSDQCLTDAYYENCVGFRNGYNIESKNGRNITIKNSSFLEAGNGFSSDNDYKAGILQTESFDSDKTSSWLYENVLVANNKYGCYGGSDLSPQDVTFDHALFYNNSDGDFFWYCANVVKKNITQGINPNLTSLAYVDSSSPAFTAGKNGGPVGADLRCRYISRFENDQIVTEHTSESMWPLPDFINERVKAETLEIHGVAYDVNAKVLDALGPRDNEKIKCPQAGPTDTPPAAPTGMSVQ